MEDIFLHFALQRESFAKYDNASQNDVTVFNMLKGIAVYHSGCDLVLLNHSENPLTPHTQGKKRLVYSSQTESHTCFLHILLLIA